MQPIENSLLRELLCHWPVGRLGTIGESHQPHLVPIVFCLHEESLYSPVDGKRKRGHELKRLRNVASNEAFSLLFDHYDDDWQRLWWVRLDGVADVYVPAAAHDATLRGLLLGKYPQYGDFPFGSGQVTYLRFRWQTVAAWSQGDLESNLRSALGSFRD